MIEGAPRLQALSSLAGASSWRASPAPALQPAAHLTCADVRTTVERLGLQVLHMASLPAEPEHQSDYTGLITLLARKPRVAPSDQAAVPHA